MFLVRILAGGAGLFLAVCCVAAAQSSITGRLLEKRGDSVSPGPVRHCTVFVTSAEHGPLVGEYPDEKGRFRLEFPSDPQVAAGAICPGFQLYRGGEEREADEATLTRDCSLPGVCADIELLLEPLAVIEGEVTDDNGAAAEGVHLGLLERADVPTPPVYQAVSDDRGEFRFFHVPPGEYELARLGRGSAQSLMEHGEPLRVTVGPGEVVNAGRIRVPSLGAGGFSVPMVRVRPLPGTPPAIGSPAEPNIVSGGVVVGHVRDSLGNPVPGATVSLLGNSNTNNKAIRRRAASDAAGEVRFADIPNGAFWVDVRLAGGSLEGGRHHVELDGPNPQAVLNLIVRRRPVLTGRVVDERGTPMPDTRIQLYSVTASDGVPALSPGQSTTTDDRGVYRISVPEPGRYWVMATHMEASFPLGSAPQPTGSVFYPNSPDMLSSLPAELAFDQPETTFDITLPPAPRTELAAGLVSGFDGTPCGGCTYSLCRVEGPYHYELVGDSISERLPGFQYRGIPPGQYRIYVSDDREDNIGWWAIEDVVLTEDKPAPVRITTRPPIAVGGRVTLEDPPLGWISENRDNANAVQVQLTQLGDGFFTIHGFSTSGAQLSPDQQEFQLGPLPPATFRVQVWTLGADAYLAAVVRQGRGLPSSLLDFSQPGAWSNLELRVRFDMARPAIRVPAQTFRGERWITYRVVLVPDPERNPFGHYMEGYCGPDGGCEIAPIPPGLYRAFVAPEETSGALALRDPEVRNRLAAWGRDIDFSPGENSMVELKPLPLEVVEGN